MRLHWCALDDPGGALGLKNRLINKRGHLVQTAAQPLSYSYSWILHPSRPFSPFISIPLLCPQSN